ncbi:MAG: universal stress protein [Thermoanaerobaculia bacterium]|nr:universal stress protein [Thermoanaerobaculia bacterium]
MNPIRTVLCPVDFSQLSERALQLAVEMCRRTGAHLVLQHNLDTRPPDYLTMRWMWSEEHQPSDQQIADAAPQLIRALFRRIPKGISHEAKLTRGPLDVGLLEVARLLPADAIVMGTHGPSTAEHHSLTERVILKAPCPVLVAGESYRPEAVFDERGEPPEEMSVLLPFDFTPHSQEALSFALKLAEHMPHRMHLLHVAPRSESGATSQGEAGLRDRLGELMPVELQPRVTIEVAHGDPVRRILAAADRVAALFILMGAHGKSVLQRFLFGATTLGVLHGSRCPVLFVPRGLDEKRPAWQMVE